MSTNVPNSCAPRDNLCYPDENETSSKPQNPERDSTCRPPDLCRIWKKRRPNAVKPGCWDDPQVCQYDPWDENSPFQEQEEISTLLRSNVFPGYTYTGKFLSSYDGHFSANVFKRRCESEIPEQFRKRPTDFTRWMEKMIQERSMTHHPHRVVGAKSGATVKSVYNTPGLRNSAE